MILFVGTIEQGYFLEEFDTVEYTRKAQTLSELRSDILNSTQYDYIVIDVSNFIEHYKDQVSEVEKIKKATNATIVIFAVGFDPQSALVLAMREIGVKFFILSSILGERKDEFQRVIDNQPTVFLEPCYQENDLSEEAKPTIPPIQNKKTIISIVGACKRIGTTTQAIQLVKYLMTKGYSVAYIEMNENHYVERLKTLYDVPQNDEEKNIGRVVYQSVDLYYKKEKISEVLSAPYDYYIYDFGAYSDRNFNLINFLERDIKIVVGGAKPNEIDSVGDFITKTLIHDISFIFSFCPASEHAEILELMQEKAEKTVFASYTPDPFLYSTQNDSSYQKILKVTPSKNSKTPKKKKHHFPFLRGKENG